MKIWTNIFAQKANFASFVIPEITAKQRQKRDARVFAILYELGKCEKTEYWIARLEYSQNIQAGKLWSKL